MSQAAMDTTTAHYEALSLYIGGRFLSADGRPEQDVINPCDRQGVRPIAARYAPGSG